MIWRHGSTTIEFLLSRSRLERIADSDLHEATRALFERATKRLVTAESAHKATDFEGAFANAYDVYPLSAEALLLLQGLRATGGDGSHVTVEDAVCAQFDTNVDDFTKPIFERFRQGRHAAQYFDPRHADRTGDDAGWALDTAARALGQAKELVTSGVLGVYE